MVAVSSDSLETHRRFASSIGIKFLLLSDPDQRVARRYGSDGSDGLDRPTVYVIQARWQGELSRPRARTAGEARVRVDQACRCQGGAAMRRLMAVAVLAILAPPVAAQGEGGLGLEVQQPPAGLLHHLPRESGRRSRRDSKRCPAGPPGRHGRRPAGARQRPRRTSRSTVPWMPAAVCIYRFGRADVGGRELVAATGGSEMIGLRRLRRAGHREPARQRGLRPPAVHQRQADLEGDRFVQGLLPAGQCDLREGGAWRR